MANFTQFWTALENNKNQIQEMEEKLLTEMGRVYHQNKGSGTPEDLKKAITKLDNISISNEQKKEKDNKNSTKFRAFNFERKVYTKFTMPKCHFDSYNLWILKPTHLNRGRGIHVFRDLQTL